MKHRITVNEAHVTVEGIYTPGTKGDYLTAPTRSDFDIEHVWMNAHTADGKAVTVDVKDILHDDDYYKIQLECIEAEEDSPVARMASVFRHFDNVYQQPALVH